MKWFFATISLLLAVCSAEGSFQHGMAWELLRLPDRSGS